MYESEFIKWVNTAFSSLPVSREPLFSQLWGKRKLSYEGSNNLIDLIDENNAKLICSALDKRQLLLNVLPDDNIHRGPLIFGTALVRSAVDCILNEKQNHTVLYYGTTLGFKNSLSNTSINGTYLDSVFASTQMSGKYKKDKQRNDYTAFLPRVICVYHPANPEHFIQIYRPDWIVIDCAKETNVDWLVSLLSYCKKKSIPTVGWSQNNFSNVITQFADQGASIFFSPKKMNNDDNFEYAKLFTNDEQRKIIPLVLAGKEILEIDELFKKAKIILRSLKVSTEMRIKSDGIRLVWKLLRSLEKLTLPMKIYNSEAKSFWNVHSISEIKMGAEKYISLIEDFDRDLALKMRQSLSMLNEIYLLLEQGDPPYWSALSNYVMDRSPENTLRVIVFPSRTQKQLFSYTLLAKYNLTEEELKNDSRILLRTVKELLSPSIPDKALLIAYLIQPIFIGLPDLYNVDLFYQCINKYSARIIVYPHQLASLHSILNSYNKKDIAQKQTSISTLEKITSQQNKFNYSFKIERYAFENTFQKLTISGDNKVTVRELEYEDKIRIGDFHTEMATLLETSQDDEDTGHLISIDIEKSKPVESGDSNSIFLETVIEISLQDDYRLFVDPAEQLNIIKGDEIHKIYSRAIRVGNLIMCVQNQARKDLYDLLIERIHDHKGLAIHLNMIQKWREEFHLSYLIWKDKNKPEGLQYFWQKLLEKGADVATPLTVNNWLQGYTIRPQDSRNILRVGQVLNSTFIINNYQEIANAASRIVGLHISLSHKLKKWLHGESYNIERDDNSLIDEELGLTLGEIRSSIKILKVVSVRSIQEPMLKSMIGVLQNN